MHDTSFNSGGCSSTGFVSEYIRNNFLRLIPADAKSSIAIKSAAVFDGVQMRIRCCRSAISSNRTASTNVVVFPVPIIIG